MGQRLNFEITTDRYETVLASGYYHWSGYTGSAIEIAKSVYNAIDEMGEEEYDKLYKESKVLLAIRLLEATGAGLCEVARDDDISSKDAAAKMFPDKEFKPVVDRNTGLIDITEGGIDSIRTWEEARVQFCIDDKHIDFFSAICLETVESYLDCRYEGEDSTDQTLLPKVKLDLSVCNYCEDMTYEQFTAFDEFVAILENAGLYSAAYDRTVVMYGDEPTTQHMVVTLIA